MRTNRLDSSQQVHAPAAQAVSPAQQAQVSSPATAQQGAITQQAPLDPSTIDAIKQQTAQQQGGVQDPGIGRPTVHAKKYKAGNWYELSGKIQNRKPMMGIGGEAAPEGSYLVLSKPIKVGSHSVKELLVNGRELTDGASARLAGRIDERKWGGVERPATTYFELSGVSDLKAGEPRYDGKGGFTNAKGDKLEVVADNRPQMYDAPARLFVLDPANEKVHLASIGGHIAPTVNPFHGFRGTAKIGLPTDADRAAVKVQGDQVTDANGKVLDKLGEQNDQGVIADAMTRAWYLDREAGKVYGFDSGGIAGFHLHLAQVITL